MNVPFPEPWLFRLTLKFVLREVRKHPHTLLQASLTYLTGRGPLPASTPTLLAFALEVLKGQTAGHPNTLLARVVGELQRVADEVERRS